MNPAAPPRLQTLADLRWQRLRVDIRNRRNTFAKEHPLFVFKAICLYALGRAKVEVDFVFHPAGDQPAPDRVQKDRVFAWEVVFPHADAATVAAFGEGLRAHLSDPKYHWELTHLGQPEERSLAVLEREHATLDSNAAEVCAEFIAPFSFNPGKSPAWAVEPQQFVDACCGRLERLFPGIALPHSPPPEVMPWYWDLRQHFHRAKSGGQGAVEAIQGMAGPLYLRGGWRDILPLLLVCGELHIGRKAWGAFHLSTVRPAFARKLAAVQRWDDALRELSEQNDIDDHWAPMLADAPALARELAATVSTGRWRPEAAHAFSIEKTDGSARMLAVLPPRDRVVHEVLHRVLAPVLERAFEECSTGYRPGRSVETARTLIAAAIREGYTHVLEADVEAFFDEVDWALLDAALDRHIPRADTAMRAALTAAIRTPLVLSGKPIQRTRGLLQGSPLSPLLANLFLDRFDEEITRRGFRLVRYADDFVVLAKGPEEAARARTAVEETLAALHLRLSPEKTGITTVEHSFSFLGLQLGAGLEEELVEHTALRKTLYLRQDYSFVGIEGTALVVKKEKALLSRVPLARLNAIVALGQHSFSARLLEYCMEKGVPVAFCSATGHYHGTLRPDSRTHYERGARHSTQHTALGPQGILATAREVVGAKLANYLAWLKADPEPAGRALVAPLEAALAKANRAATVEELRGHEGSAARLVHPHLASRVKAEGFTSATREPRSRRDRWNALLDFASFLIFTRLNILTRAHGLNPYLGFLHSAQDHFESLVCDLQEPFRCRTERFLIRTLNRRIITSEDFAADDTGKWHFVPDAVPRFLEAFERELDIRLADEPASLRMLLSAQVQWVQAWADGQGELRFVRTLRR